ncbi:MAG: SusE domain-containing protein, partial [Alistipes sp.]|nr:SusE domain-containing protein [Alistipes sp.]
MKKILSTFLLAATMAAGCDSPDVRFDIPTPPDTMHLEVSSESVVLDPSRKDAEAVRFTWDAAAMRGESLTYYFKMDVEENNFATSIDKIAIADGERSISFTHKQMNDLLARWGVEPGDRTSLVAEVIAESTNSSVYQKPEISRVVFEVRSYTTKLFLCGSATAAGDDVAQALQMHEVIAGQTYEWSGRLEEGGIWFPLSQETALPAYGRGEDDSMLAYYEAGEVEPVRIAGPGYYSVTVDVDARSIAARETVYLVGSGCAAGWRPQDALAMTQPDPTKRIFVW